MTSPESPAEPRVRNELSSSILRVLAYFDIFKHPLTAEEIAECCDLEMTDISQVTNALLELCRQGCIQQTGHHFSLDDASSVELRQWSSTRCEEFLGKARRYSRLIAQFPFVRGVCISGSLSKGRADDNADVDYFIITAPGRLWVCRTMLALFKKTFLLNSHKYFCLNYFVDSEHLSIPEQNIYTATEIAFLIPTYSYSNYTSFLEANPWISAYYPNKRPVPPVSIYESTDRSLKRWAEMLLNGAIGEILERLCLQLTLFYRQRKFHQMTPSEFQHGMRTTRGVAKHHPHSFQAPVLQAYEQKLMSLQQRFGLRLL